jgi:hypothetical protein
MTADTPQQSAARNYEIVQEAVHVLDRIRTVCARRRVADRTLTKRADRADGSRIRTLDAGIERRSDFSNGLRKPNFK